MKLANLELHVEELVLRGFAPGDRYRISGAVERELAHLFAEQGIPPSLIQNGEVVGLDGGAFEATPDAKPEAIGARVARAVYGGMAK